MSDELLQILQVDPRRIKNAVPLLMEFKINPETAPFLVSSTTSVLWVRRPHAGRVRAAIRDVGKDVLYREIVEEVFHMGTEAQWGNAVPFTPAGILQGVEHLRFYNITEIEILTSDVLPWELPETVEDIRVEKVPWIPDGMALIVPVERDFLGTLWFLDSDRLLAVVHNSSRALVVAWNGE